MSGLKIIKAGPLSLLQDWGRTGQQHLGISQGGACDPHAYFWSNHLLSNKDNSAALEITFGPFAAEFHENTLISICGADLNARINGKSVKNWCTHKVNAGDSLMMSPGNNGIRAYLGVKSGFATQKNFGSRSEVPREKLFKPQVVAGAILKYTAQDITSLGITFTPERFIPDYRADLTLRVLPAYQHQLFEEQAINTLKNNQYIISKSSDRMGYRLAGENIVWGHENIISEGIALGSIQVPPDGQPIVLLNDRQSVGGYPKIGCVCKKDCAQLSQRQGGQKIDFQYVQLDSLSPTRGNTNYLHPLYYY